ncbi:molybdopterin molybdotransferase MoeA [Roseococcus sp. SYP-B2431]|uniref:molybdopterin molybdotransferase MoeA n=1 Tax=Roseococcus sp. SYP-B2431 TaxID=2496640 RepID=UPI0013F49E36|nr:molybdopterin molybdotransferase MoeA [Roseococcus sp. SYP-B2431]
MLTALPPDPLAILREPLARLLAIARPIAGRGTVTAEAAMGRVLAAPLAALHHVPPFDQSAMDGYALGPPAGAAWRITARLAAGDADGAPLGPGEAARIFTGAPVPAGTHGVVQQEKVIRQGDGIAVPEGIPAGTNIRRAGEDLRAGVTLLEAGQRLDARHIALAVAAGHDALPVARRLRVALASTGAELRRAGGGLGSGQVHDSNGPMLRAMLRAPDVELVELGILPDEPGPLRDALLRAAGAADLIVTSGGVSVGEEDHMAGAILAAGGTIEVVHLPIRPGKPVKAGRLGAAVILALPGNPLAAYVNLWLVGRRVLDRLAGAPARPLRPMVARAGFREERKPGRVEFAPVRFSGTDALGLPVLQLLGRGSSARLAPLAAADGLCVIGPEVTRVEEGDLLGVLPF